MLKVRTLNMIKVCGSEIIDYGRAYLEGTSPIMTGLRTFTMSGVKLVRTSASPSGRRFTAPYKQLRALQVVGLRARGTYVI